MPESRSLFFLSLVASSFSLQWAVEARSIYLAYVRSTLWNRERIARKSYQWWWLWHLIYCTSHKFSTTHFFTSHHLISCIKLPMHHIGCLPAWVHLRLPCQHHPPAPLIYLCPGKVQWLWSQRSGSAVRCWVGVGLGAASKRPPPPHLFALYLFAGPRVDIAFSSPVSISLERERLSILSALLARYLPLEERYRSCKRYDRSWEQTSSRNKWWCKVRE